MPKPSFEQVWKRITASEGKEFRTITNLPFIYELRGDSLCPSRTEYNISKKDFAKAYELVPIGGPGEINDLVEGQLTYGQYFMISEYHLVNGNTHARKGTAFSEAQTILKYTYERDIEIWKKN